MSADRIEKDNTSFDSAEQPVMSAVRVEQSAAMATCWLCGKVNRLQSLKPMRSNDLPELVLRHIVDRYCTNTVPLICVVCDVFLSTAVKNAAECGASELAQKLLRSAEAFCNRDDQGHPTDGHGQVHSAVAMQRTCRWEPWCGTSAQATASAVAECAGDPQKQLRRIFQKYHVAAPGNKCKRSSVPQTGRHNIRSESSELPGTVLRYLLAKHQTTALKRPFYLLMVMKLLPSEWVDEAELLLRRCWSTSWGGGKILNALLFNGERIVVESRNDVRGHVSNECFYQNCKANDIFTCILYESKFGQDLLRIGCEHVPAHLRGPSVDLQRLGYKLAELRKVNHARRCVFFRTFSTFDARRKWFERHRDKGSVVVTPLW